ncbi:MAG: hypothetical protein ACI9QL_000123 [Candidatus Omnitrophota bacterium]
MKRDFASRDEFNRQTCRNCGFWLTRPDEARCPSCGWPYPLKNRKVYKKYRLAQRLLKGGLFGTLGGLFVAGLNAWVAHKGFDLFAIPATAIITGLFGGLVAKAWFKDSERGTIVGLGVFAGAVGSILYALGPVLPTLILAGIGGLAGQRFLKQSLFNTRVEKLLGDAGLNFHQKVLQTSERRLQAMRHKWNQLQKIMDELKAGSSHEHHPDAELAHAEAVKTLQRAMLSYEVLIGHTRTLQLENQIQHLSDVLTEVNDDNRSAYQAELDRVRQTAIGLRKELNARTQLDDASREKMVAISVRAEESLEHLHARLHRDRLAKETREISGITDAALNDPNVLAPRMTPDHSFDGLDTSWATFEVFNDLEDEYVRLKRENQLDADEDSAWLAPES